MLKLLHAALDWVKKIVTVPEVGQVYKGKVKTIVQFGAFVEILPNKDGLASYFGNRLEKGCKG